MIMASIKERAKKNATIFVGYNDTMRTGFEVGYELGAKEQQEIIVKKACEWLGKNIGFLDSPYQDILIGKFRKSMEE